MIRCWMTLRSWIEGEGHLSNLVEKNGPAMGQLEHPRFPRLSAPVKAPAS
jgi:hypothetical protein